MQRPSVVIRLGAAHNSVTVDGVVFDRSRMTREERSKLRRLIRDTYENLNRRGLWGRQVTRRAA